MTGLHQSITNSFLPVGHTKFSPDWCFGLMKQRYRRTKVDSLQDLVDVVNGSAIVNFAQLVGTQEGDVLVPTYDWCSYLSPYFKRVDNIKKLHSFQISSPSSGDVEVVVREYSDTPEQHVSLVRDTTWIPSSTVLPPVCKPVGLRSSNQQADSGICSTKFGSIVQIMPKTFPAPCHLSLASPLLIFNLN